MKENALIIIKISSLGHSLQCLIIESIDYKTLNPSSGYLLNKKPLRWANTKIEDMSKERSAYINGLRKADGGDFSPMISYLEALCNE